MPFRNRALVRQCRANRAIYEICTRERERDGVDAFSKPCAACFNHYLIQTDADKSCAVLKGTKSTEFVVRQKLQLHLIDFGRIVVLSFESRCEMCLQKSCFSHSRLVVTSLVCDIRTRRSRSKIEIRPPVRTGYNSPGDHKRWPTNTNHTAQTHWIVEQNNDGATITLDAIIFVNGLFNKTTRHVTHITLLPHRTAPHRMSICLRWPRNWPFSKRNVLQFESLVGYLWHNGPRVCLSVCVYYIASCHIRTAITRKWILNR